MAVRKHRPAAHLSDYLPWAAMVVDTVIVNKDGSFLSTIAYRGLDSLTPSELMANRNRSRINQALKPLWSNRWALFWEADRHVAAAYPDSRFPDPVTGMIETERRRHFGAEGMHLETGFFLTLVYLPPEQHVTKLTDLLYKGQLKLTGGTYARELTQYQNTVGQIAGMLRLFLPLARILTGNELLIYLQQTISTRRHCVAVPEQLIYLNGLLADNNLAGGVHPRLED